jgi:peptidase E
MKTKYILHGGGSFSSDKIEENREFFSEILKDVPEEANVLLVPFAKDTDRIPEAITKIIENFNKAKTQESILFEIANEEDFPLQVRSADIVYFHGGISTRLLKTLKNFPDLIDLLEGKIIAGESAGANVWGTVFFSPNANAVLDGFGVLPIKIIPHYSEEKKGKLDGVGEGLEEVFLPEYGHKVFYK